MNAVPHIVFMENLSIDTIIILTYSILRLYITQTRFYRLDPHLKCHHTYAKIIEGIKVQLRESDVVDWWKDTNF